MGDLTAHFSRSEFKCHHCVATSASPQLLQIVENLRAIVRRPLKVVSGFRCVPHNGSVGGASLSRHLFGDAADLEVGYATVTQAEAAGAVGIGTKGRWVTHVDWRPGPRVRWVY